MLVHLIFTEITAVHCAGRALSTIHDKVQTTAPDLLHINPRLCSFQWKAIPEDGFPAISFFSIPVISGSPLVGGSARRQAPTRMQQRHRYAISTLVTPFLLQFQHENAGSGPRPGGPSWLPRNRSRTRWPSGCAVRPVFLLVVSFRGNRLLKDPITGRRGGPHRVTGIGHNIPTWRRHVGTHPSVMG